MWDFELNPQLAKDMKQTFRFFSFLGVLITILLIGYTIEIVLANPIVNRQVAEEASLAEPAITVTQTVPLKTTATPFLPNTATPIPPTATVIPATPTPTRLSAALWKSWPVVPETVSEALKAVYRRGLAAGNVPTHFSILGDCQSEPDEFLGVYDRDQAAVLALEPALQTTINHFQGSFDRYSPTVKSGTTEGALLFALWNENRDGQCLAGEIPIDCELRVHKPVIAFIHVGTHWETRNEHYLTIIIEKLLDNGTVPVLVTKADNLEFDERINQTLAKLAEQYDLPLWNFWSSVQQLNNHGLVYGSGMYLSREAKEIHRLDAVQALDFVWRTLNE